MNNFKSINKTECLKTLFDLFQMSQLNQLIWTSLNQFIQLTVFKPPIDWLLWLQPCLSSAMHWKLSKCIYMYVCLYQTISLFVLVRTCLGVWYWTWWCGSTVCKDSDMGMKGSDSGRLMIAAVLISI